MTNKRFCDILLIETKSRFYLWRIFEKERKMTIVDFYKKGESDDKNNSSNVASKQQTAN